MSGFVSPDKLQLLRVVKQGRPRSLSDEVRVNAIIPANGKFDHHLNTDVFYPIFATNFMAVIWLVDKTSTTFTVKFNIQPTPPNNTLTYRLTTNGGQLSIPPGVKQATLTHNLNDATAAFFFTPTWNSNVWVISRTANATVIGFNVAPLTAQVVYYGRFDLATSSVDSAVAVVASAQRHTHTHGLGHVMADVFTTPTWNTTTYLHDPSRTENQATIRFSTFAPAGKTIDVAAGVPMIGELL